MPQTLDRAGVRLAQPDDALERRGLAGAVRPEEPEDLAVLDLEADAPRRLHVAVVLVEILNDDFRRRGRHQPSHPLMIVSRRSKPKARSVTTTMGGPCNRLYTERRTRRKASYTTS